MEAYSACLLTGSVPRATCYPLRVETDLPCPLPLPSLGSGLGWGETAGLCYSRQILADGSEPVHRSPSCLGQALGEGCPLARRV